MSMILALLGFYAVMFLICLAGSSSFPSGSNRNPGIGCAAIMALILTVFVLVAPARHGKPSGWRSRFPRCLSEKFAIAQAF
jgi:hypothetical protein